MPNQPYYLIWVDDTPVAPDAPLDAQTAVQLFLGEIRDGETHVEIRVCDEESLRLAGIDFPHIPGIDTDVEEAGA